MDYATKGSQKIEVGQQIGCIALCQNGDLLLAMQDGIYRVNGNGEKSLRISRLKLRADASTMAKWDLTDAFM